MPLTGFEEVRSRRGRLAALWAIVIWGVAVFTSFFVGIAMGLVALLGLGFPLQGFLDVAGLDVDIGILFTLGWLATVLFALVGYPLSLLLADRIVPWALDARAADSRGGQDAALRSSLDTVGLAAGEDALLMVIDETWVDATALGRRGGRPTVLQSTGGAVLDDDHRELLAAGALADSLAGNAAARARLACAAPALIPFVLARRTWGLLRRHRTVGAVLAGVWLVGLSIALIVDSMQPGSEVNLGPGGMFAPMAVLMFTALIAVFALIGFGIAAVWAGLLTILARPIAKRARLVADVGMASVVRDPEEWVEFLTVAGRRQIQPPWWSALAVDWLLPRDPGEAARRIQHLVEEVPGARHSIGQTDPA